MTVKAQTEQTVTLTLPSVPPSLNRVGSRGGMMAFHRKKKQLQRELEGLLMASRMPRNVAAKVTAEATLRFPVVRRRDLDNHNALLSKALGDALVNGGWLGDDVPEQYALLVRFDSELGPARTLISLRWRTL